MSKVLTTPGLQKLIELTQNDLLLKANKADLGTAAYTASTAYDQAGAASTAETNAKNYADGLASNYATAAQGALADTAVQPNDLATVATTGDYDDLLNKPTIPAAQVNSDWNANSGVAEILNKPTTLSGYGITDAVQTGHEVIAFQAPTAQNNYTWYRKYADGWVEQGGVVVASGAAILVNLIVPMQDTNYFIGLTGKHTSNTAGSTTSVSTYSGAITTSGFYVNNYIENGGTRGNGTAFWWEVKGMAA